MRRCKICGKKFEPTFEHRTVCSDECWRLYKKLYRERVSEVLRFKLLKDLPIEPMTAKEMVEVYKIKPGHIEAFYRALQYLVRDGKLYELKLNLGSKHGSQKFKTHHLFKKGYRNKTYYATTPLMLTKLFIESIDFSSVTRGKRKAITHLFRKKILPLWYRKGLKGEE